ncbi:hypothetical protein, partial [Photobacterium sp. 1_MG-2023]|uniref:hypothetical protein n=1 Tax=Photobacterium sp. 1_MG-2023 TaxID=3062646 RepID=UPI0026E39F79
TNTRKSSLNRSNHSKVQSFCRIVHSVQMWLRRMNVTGFPLRGNDKEFINQNITVIPAQAGNHSAPGSKRVQIIMEQIKSQQGSVILSHCSQCSDVAPAHERHWVPACAGTTKTL